MNDDSKILQPMDYIGKMKPCKKLPVVVKAIQLEENCRVKTLEGIMSGNSGDYLIEDVTGEFYICNREIFEATYQWV